MHIKKQIFYLENIFFKSIQNLIDKKYIKKKGEENYFYQRSEKDSEIKINEMSATFIINLARSQYPLYTHPFLKRR